MIKFFRKIRRQLLTENRFTKYLIYAVGEIILVVIGILIAVQINTWNESRKQEMKTENLKLRLSKQLSNNIENTQFDRELVKEYVECIRKLMSFVGEPNEQHDKILLDSLMMYSAVDYRLSLNMSAIQEAQDNGEISAIKNDTLRAVLYHYSTYINQLEQYELMVNHDNNNYFVTYLYKNGNLRSQNFSASDKLVLEIGDSKLDHNNYGKILMDTEFENLLFNRLMYAENMLSSYTALCQFLEYIIELLDNEK